MNVRIFNYIVRSPSIVLVLCPIFVLQIWNSTSLKNGKMFIRSKAKWILVTMVYRTCRTQGQCAYYYVIVINMLLFKWCVCKQWVYSAIERMAFYCFHKQTNNRMYGVPKSVEKVMANGWTEAENNKMRNIRYALNCMTYFVLFWQPKSDGRSSNSVNKKRQP